MATAERKGAVGPLLVRTDAPSSRNELTETPRAARCKTNSRKECDKPLITKPGVLKRTRSIADSASSMSAASMPRRADKALTRVLSGGMVSEFSRLSSARTTKQHIDPTIARVLSVGSPKQKRRASITTEASNMPSMILRTPSMEMVVNFTALEVHTRGLQTLTCRMGDFKALDVTLEVTGSITRSRSVNVQS